MEVTGPSEARILLASSSLTITSCVAAARLGLYDCLVTATSMLFCSVNYWRRPVYGWRRRIDILNVVSGLIYQLSVCPVLETRFLCAYLAFTVFGIICLLAARVLTGRKATLIHSTAHVLGNLANAPFYMGLVRVRKGVKT